VIVDAITTLVFIKSCGGIAGFCIICTNIMDTKLENHDTTASANPDTVLTLAMVTHSSSQV
jgi:hypothetical protein